MQELNALAVKVDTEDNMKALARLTVVVTGIKPSLKRDLDTQEVILKELNALNDLGVSFIIPYQGMKIQF
jgi:cAMP phosphodiesterase